MGSALSFRWLGAEDIWEPLLCSFDTPTVTMSSTLPRPARHRVLRKNVVEKDQRASVLNKLCGYNKEFQFYSYQTN